MAYKLSICMMVKNEEIHIERCLKSIKPITDRDDVELIIVDTGSTDRTVDICKQYTDKLYFKEWFDDFSGMRNVTILYAAGEWIFILDADETIEKYDELECFLDTDIYKTTKNNTYLVSCKNYINAKNYDLYSVFSSMRLFRNDKEFRYEGRVHNQPIYKYPVGTLDVIIGHYGYLTASKEIMEKKFIRTKTLLEQEIEKKPDDIYYLYQLATTYNMHSDIKKSYEISSKIYKLFKNYSKENQKESFAILTVHLTNCFMLNKYNELMEASKLGISLKEDYIDAFYMLAMSYEKTGDLENAVIYFEKYLDLCKSYTTLEIYNDITVALYRNNAVDINGANLFLASYYYNKEEYLKSLSFLSELKYSEKKIQISLASYFRLEKYDKLKELYLDIKENKDDLLDYAISLTENELKNCAEDVQVQVYKIFSDLDDEYGLYSEYKLLDSEEKDKKYELSKKIIKLLDLKKKSPLYPEAMSFIISVENISLRMFSGMDKQELLSLFEHSKEYHYYEVYKRVNDWLTNTDFKTNSLTDILNLKLLFETYLLSLSAEYHATGIQNIIDDNIGLFDKYVNLGIEAMPLLYNTEGINLKYKYIYDIEAKFLMLMYLYRQNIERSNIKAGLKYYREAAKTYPDMAQFLKEYIDI